MNQADTIVRDFAVLQPPIPPSENCPYGLPGAIRLNGFVYLVHALADKAFKIVGVRFDGLGLTKAKDFAARFYHVSAEDGSCTCPESTFRGNRPCKHFLASVRCGLLPEDTGSREQTQRQEQQPVEAVANGANGAPEEDDSSIPF